MEKAHATLLTLGGFRRLRCLDERTRWRIDLGDGIDNAVVAIADHASFSLAASTRPVALQMPNGLPPPSQPMMNTSTIVHLVRGLAKVTSVVLLGVIASNLRRHATTLLA